MAPTWRTPSIHGKPRRNEGTFEVGVGRAFCDWRRPVDDNRHHYLANIIAGDKVSDETGLQKLTDTLTMT
jgi:hypothetical protein